MSLKKPAGLSARPLRLPPGARAATATANSSPTEIVRTERLSRQRLSLETPPAPDIWTAAVSSAASGSEVSSAMGGNHDDDGTHHDHAPHEIMMNDLELLLGDATAGGNNTQVVMGPNSLNTPEMLSFDNFERAFETKMNEKPVKEEEEVVAEINVDVNHLWGHVSPAKQDFNFDPMACFNPLDVEGKKVAAPGKGKKKMLKVNLPPPVLAEETKQPDTLNLTPAVDKMLETQAAGSGFDLLEWVTNTDLPVNDPQFVAMTGVTEKQEPDLASLGIQVVDSSKEHQPPVVVEPAKPAVSKGKKVIQIIIPESALIAPSTSRSTPSPAPSSTVTSGALDHAYEKGAKRKEKAEEDNPEDPKYRRMRDLNNIASKKCRLNRKRKRAAEEEEEAELLAKNAELKMKVKFYEETVAKMKRRFIEKISNPGRKATKEDDQPLDIDALRKIFEK